MQCGTILNYRKWNKIENFNTIFLWFSIFDNLHTFGTIFGSAVEWLCEAKISDKNIYLSDRQIWCPFLANAYSYVLVQIYFRKPWYPNIYPNLTQFYLNHFKEFRHISTNKIVFASLCKILCQCPMRIKDILTKNSCFLPYASVLDT